MGGEVRFRDRVSERGARLDFDVKVQVGFWDRGSRSDFEMEIGFRFGFWDRVRIGFRGQVQSPGWVKFWDVGQRRISG